MPACQQLHFLQMACEKICKAHLCGEGTDPAALAASHAYIAKTLPVIARQQLGPQKDNWLMPALRKLARQIELLAPAVKAGGSVPANCEYPWEGPAGDVLVPAEYNFQLDLLFEPAGRTLLVVLRRAISDLA